MGEGREGRGVGAFPRAPYPLTPTLSPWERGHPAIPMFGSVPASPIPRGLPALVSVPAPALSGRDPRMPPCPMREPGPDCHQRERVSRTRPRTLFRPLDSRRPICHPRFLVTGGNGATGNWLSAGRAVCLDCGRVDAVADNMGKAAHADPSAEDRSVREERRGRLRCIYEAWRGSDVVSSGNPLSRHGER